MDHFLACVGMFASLKLLPLGVNFTALPTACQMPCKSLWQTAFSCIHNRILHFLLSAVDAASSGEGHAAQVLAEKFSGHLLFVRLAWTSSRACGRARKASRARGTSLAVPTLRCLLLMPCSLLFSSMLLPGASARKEEEESDKLNTRHAHIRSSNMLFCSGGDLLKRSCLSQCGLMCAQTPAASSRNKDRQNKSSAGSQRQPVTRQPSAPSPGKRLGSASDNPGRPAQSTSAQRQQEVTHTSSDKAWLPVDGVSSSTQPARSSSPDPANDDVQVCLLCLQGETVLKKA